MNDQMNVDQLEDLKDDLADQMADMEDRQNFFAEAAKGEEDDELLAQLDDLEAENVEEEMAGMQVGVAPISAPPVGETNTAEQEAQKELDELEKMMAA